MGEPLQQLFERVERIRELTEAGGTLGGAPAVVDGVTPRFRATVMMREQRRLLVEPLGVVPLDRPADRLVKDLR